MHPLQLILALAMLFSGCASISAQTSSQNTSQSTTKAAEGMVSTSKTMTLDGKLAHIRLIGDASEGAPGCKSPILVKHARNMQEGAAAQKIWLAEHFPKYRLIEHALAKPDESGRRMEAYLIADALERERYICFDITDHFGL